ncbi:hypothetical protein GC169_12160 [bacterium]|nr:hypothetical protein [bacterium]
MRFGGRPGLGGVAAVAALMVFGAGACMAQGAPEAASGTNASAGVPTDLNGVWTNASLTGLTRPPGVSKLVVDEAEAQAIVSRMTIAGAFAAEGGPAPPISDPDAPAPEAGAADFGVKAYDQFWVAPGERLALVKGEIRSSYIVDPPNGQVPFVDPAGIARQRQIGATRYATGIGGNEGPEATGLAERCLIGFGNTGGPGMLSTLYNNTHRIVQAPDHVMILVEMVHDARIIPTFASAEEARRNHRPDVMTPWLGDSVGWYEGSTLVIETINVRPEQARASAIPLSPRGKVTERLTRYSDHEIFYTFTVEDPTIYTRPWTAELSFYDSDEDVFEYACHEGNYAMPGILGGARIQEAAAANAGRAR